MKRFLLTALCAVLACTTLDSIRADDVKPIIAVTSPAYSSDISGDTPVKITAPGMKTVQVKCWQQGPGLGADSTVADVSLDNDGKGEFTFPANKYPHGPLMIRISGKAGSAEDTCILQVYNESGVSWEEGIPAKKPPGAENMSLIFEDDFKKLPSISGDGKGATYDAHKPGGGDFSKIPFVDVKDANNPFSQVDTYLRIRADQNKNSTGLLASVNNDFSGIMVGPPCYFECRFVAQSMPGSWPAFWLLTPPETNPFKNLCDEYDIIEGYGGTGPKQPNFTGYNVTSHYWNQKVRGKQVPDDMKIIMMKELSNKSSWYDTFHTYGMKITETESIYYLDDIEVLRYPTHSPLGKTGPFFFLINYAIGGASGWPLDLSRYNGVADMYVDYVRVFSGKPVVNHYEPAAGESSKKVEGIGFNFSVPGDASTELQPADVTGSSDVAQSHWNNLAGVSGALQDVKDSTGKAVANVTATWSVPPGDNANRSQVGRDWGFHDTDFKLQKGYIQSGGTLKISNIPYPKYTVYVYIGAGDNGGKGKVTISSPAGGVDAHATYFYNFPWANGSFVASEGTSLDKVEDGNMVVFTGNTAKEISLTWDGTLERGLTGASGVQIVAEP